MIKKVLILCTCVELGFATITHAAVTESPNLPLREFNGAYQGKNLDYVAFPIGGMGSGMFCLDGTGALSHMSLKNRPDLANVPYAFAAICVKGVENGAKVLEGPVPTWKIFSYPNSGLGHRDKTYGLPRFENASFQARFPFAEINLNDRDVPLDVHITGWNPFIPTDQDNSSLPVGMLEYSFKNTTDKTLETVFSYNAKNFVDGAGVIRKVKNGFSLLPPEHKGRKGLAIYVDDNSANVDCCWFRGGWFDAQTILWQNISSGNMVSTSPTDGIAPGASIYVPLRLQPGETQTVRVNFCWYFPDSKLNCGKLDKTGAAFKKTPAYAVAPNSNQQVITGYIGERLVNSSYNGGNGLVGILESSDFRVSKRYLKFLVGGGNVPERTSVNLVVDDNIVLTATGNQSEYLNEQLWDLSSYQGKTAKIRIVDMSAERWGYILADQFVLTDNKDENLKNISTSAELLDDFERNHWGKWHVVDSSVEEQNFFPKMGKDDYYRPWYSERFSGLKEVISYWDENKNQLRQNSELFSNAFYDSSLPAEVIEAIAANLTILKSPTVLRQYDGRFWAWEGCRDSWGSCHGTCTHVWNYAQALPHLFPAMERTLRETEFKENQNEEGHQSFRANMPISATNHDFHAAADGQLGGVMKAYREWRISGDTKWIRNLYPAIKKSLDYCIHTWDPKRQGCIEEPHHNTYDIEFWGPDGMCTSFYVGALTAFVEISKALGEPTKEYENLLKKGKKYIEEELFDGEYFIQNIKWEGLQATNPAEALSFGGAYSEEAKKLLKKEGPKYQYGVGCLSDGILGMWLAASCGLDEMIDNDKIVSHLNSVYKYNFKTDLFNHCNPQRPGYACGHDGGLLLCTWPKGGALSLPFVYSNEVWTGIEYQVAGHLMMKGEVEKGLDIVRACRLRYDGTVRNPFNEVECGSWYARAMSSYGMLQALTGVRYDAVDRTMYINSKVGDFKTFISTNTGFGTLEWKQGKPTLNVLYGSIDIKHYNVAGEML